MTTLKTTKNSTKVVADTRSGMDPQDMKTLFDALNTAPAWLSKRFILKNLCGWSKEWIDENAQLRTEEENQNKIGNKVGGYK
jgi:hypothetical protein